MKNEDLFFQASMLIKDHRLAVLHKRRGVEYLGGWRPVNLSPSIHGGNSPAAAEKRVEIPAKPIDTKPFYRGDNAILFPQKENKRKIQSQTTEVFAFFKFSCYRFLGIKQLGVFCLKNHLLKSHV